MSGQLNGIADQYYNKTLNGLDGDSIVGDLTITGNLIVLGTTDLFGDLDMNNFDILNTNQITSIAGVSYVWTGVQGLAGTLLTNDGAGNLTWTSAVPGGDPDVYPPSGILSIVGSAFNNTALPVVQNINVSSGVAGASARVNTNNGEIDIDGKFTTNVTATPQIHINPAGAANTAEIKLGDNLTVTSRVYGRGDAEMTSDGDMTLNVDTLATTGKLLKVQNNSNDIFQIDEDGYIINQLGTLTTLPLYNRQVFRTCIRLDGTVIPSGTSGIGNFIGAGGWVNNFLQPAGLPLPPFAGVASTGGFVNYCFLPTNAGIIRSCKLIMPYSAVALTASIVETGLVPAGGITGANLLAAVATPLATFSQVGVGANTGFTLSPSVSILPTPGAFSAGTFIAMVITPTWNNISNHDAVSPATQYYNLVTTIDFEY